MDRGQPLPEAATAVWRSYLTRGDQRSPGLEGHPGLPPFDEVAGAGGVREAWLPIIAALQRLTAPRLGALVRRADRLLADDGVVYNPIGSADQSEPGSVATPVPWVLDILPLVIGEREWRRVEAGLEQRARLLDALVTDLYQERRVLAEGVLPASLVMGHSGYLRAAHGITVGGPRQLISTAVDLGRGADGEWRVIADRTQAPSGSAFAMENRRVMSRLHPGVPEHIHVERLLPFFAAFRAAVQAAAPDTAVGVPRGVVLSPGAHSETAFDQAYLASLLGYPLVEGADLVMRDGRVWMRALGKLEPVDVVLRRVDAAYADPLFLRADSQLGVPGLVDAARRGTVSVVNGLGAGVLENPGLMAFLPDVSRRLLGEELLLESVRTFWCGDDRARSHVMAHLATMVIRPIDRTRAHSVFGGDLSRGQRDELRARIGAEPWAWVGQDLLSLSRAPVFADTGLTSRPVTWRTFAVAGQDGYTVMRGGVARVPGPTQPSAPGPFLGRPLQTSSKDVWVLAGPEAAAEGTGWLVDGPSVATDAYAAFSPRMLADLFWIGRYSARVEDLARLVLQVREAGGDLSIPPVGWRAQAVAALRQAITSVTTTDPGFRASGVDPRDEFRSLMVDASRPGTLAQGVVALKDALQGVRDQLSSDVWLVLSGVERAVADLARSTGDPTGADVVSVAEQSLAGLLGFSGIVMDTMVHDAGWHLLRAGRAVERSLNVVALLRSTVGIRRPGQIDALVIETVLAATESIITYRRRYRRRIHAEGVLDLLLFGVDNPRSVAHQVQALGEHLPGFATEPDQRAGLDRAFASASEAMEAHDAVALAHPGTDGTRVALDTYLSELDGRLRTVADVIEETYLRGPGLQRPLTDAAAVGAGR
ncbi:MAG: circularly permuted type 2 ATP-grasp protein [Propioniciclava sp.]